MRPREFSKTWTKIPRTLQELSVSMYLNNTLQIVADELESLKGEILLLKCGGKKRACNAS